MTFKSNDPALFALAAALHRTVCEKSASPGVAWPDSHANADRRLTARIADCLHLDGWTLTPAEPSHGAKLSKDFLAGAS